MLTEHAIARLRRHGLTDREVQLLQEAMDRSRTLSPACDPSRSADAVRHAAQGGDPLALKLWTLPHGDDALMNEAVQAYGRLYPC